MKRDFLIAGSYSNGQVRGGCMFYGTKKEVSEKCREMIFTWKCTPNTTYGEIYFSDVENISCVLGGWYFGDDKKIHKMDENYITELDVCINVYQ